MEKHHRCASTVKGLAIDMIQAANSGHPGLPLGAGDFATVLWRRYLTHDPQAPDWPDRDRFVLSAGHGSALLYALLHISGYDLSLDDLRQFRQYGSRTPGHPEHGHTPGVETTTGPLGQGFANAVGFAIAERYLREEFGSELVDHRTFVLVGDGCLMEGVSSESASLAGHLGLGRLIALYDDNHISIDGDTGITFTEDVLGRFTAQGWHVSRVDGHDPASIAAALDAALAVEDRPSLVAFRTIIGKDSPKAGTRGVHGSPLGADGVASTKVALGLDPEAHFAVADGVRDAFATDGAARRAAWEERVSAHPRGAELLQWFSGEGLLESIDWPEFTAGASLATRKASAKTLKAITAAAPRVLGGSADLAGSNGTALGYPWLSRDGFTGHRSIPFGVREHAMGAIANGMSLHGGLLPYVATFLVFHDYLRPALRVAALTDIPVVHVYTHDSFLLGEDGPTHQPVETLAAIRAIPGVRVLRPADATETVEAWKLALACGSPVALALTRQGLPVLDRTSFAPAARLRRGGYVLSDRDDPVVVLVATGSEVSLALQLQELLDADGVAARVVSMPCRELYLEQEPGYRQSVLPAGVPRVSVEAGSTLGWDRIVGGDGLMFGLDRFGASGPKDDLAEAFGFTPTHLHHLVRGFLAARSLTRG